MISLALVFVISRFTRQYRRLHRVFAQHFQLLDIGDGACRVLTPPRARVFFSIAEYLYLLVILPEHTTAYDFARTRHSLYLVIISYLLLDSLLQPRNLTSSLSPPHWIRLQLAALH